VLALLVISPAAALVIASSLICIVLLAFMHSQVPIPYLVAAPHPSCSHRLTVTAAARRRRGGGAAQTRTACCPGPDEDEEGLDEEGRRAGRLAGRAGGYVSAWEPNEEHEMLCML
jgi:hypothetical protein